MSAMKAQRFAGLGLLLAASLIIGGVKLSQDGGSNGGQSNGSITVSGITTVGKIDFLNDPKVESLLKDKYGITVDVENEIPSTEMVDVCVDRRDELDFCWTSSEIAGEQMRQRVTPPPEGSEIIFNSPIVLYTWGPIANALIEQGIVEKTGDTYYVVEFPKLAQMVADGTQWSEIGLPQLYGSIKIYTTNPATSNSGHSFAGLLSTTFNGGRIVDETTVETVAPDVTKMFDGFLQVTTLPLFDQYLNLGMGAYPIIVAYESYLIEYSLEHQTAASQDYIRNNIITLYPEPTVWTSQPLVAFSEDGERFMNALRDPEIQRIGWELHGFRPGVPSEPIDRSVVDLPGIPETFDSIVHMPKPDVMDELVRQIMATPVAALKPESYEVRS